MIVWGSYRDDLVAAFAQDCDDLLRPQSATWIVTSGLRSMAAQAVDYAQGRTTPGPIITHARPGSSAHNYGLAIDVALSVNGQPTWNYAMPEWSILWAAIRASPQLHAGEDFPPVTESDGTVVDEADPPHIERYNWRGFIPPQPEAEA